MRVHALRGPSALRARLELAVSRGRAEGSRHLDRAVALMDEVGAIAYAPQIHRARAECASAAGDHAAAAAERAAADRLLAQMTAGDYGASRTGSAFS
jgi:hypothetical protein